MLPHPLHPAVVHLPIALALLSPLFAVVALVAIRRGWLRERSWGAMVALQILLALATLGAVRSGEAEEDVVAEVVGEQYVEAHEEAGEQFLWLCGVGVLLSIGGLLPGGWGRVLRPAFAVFLIGLLAAAARVGHLGGELVYVHGAAAAYASAPPRAARPGERGTGGALQHSEADDELAETDHGGDTRDARSGTDPAMGPTDEESDDGEHAAAWQDGAGP